MSEYQEALYQLFSACIDHREHLHISDAGFQSLRFKVLGHREDEHDVGRGATPMQGFVDLEYSRWHSKTFGKRQKKCVRTKVKSRPVGNSAANPANQVVGVVAGSQSGTAMTQKKNRRPSRRKRREQYHRVQREYSKNRQR